MKKICLFIFFVLICGIFTSCFRKEEIAIELTEKVPLSLSPDVTWALVTDPYAAYKTEKSWSSDSQGYCRKGEILLVLGKALDSNNGVWYKFEYGWLPSSCLTVYSNRYKAQFAAKKLGISE